MKKRNTLIKLLSLMLIWVLWFPDHLPAQDKKLWLSGGQNQLNTRNASSENKISPATAGNLTVKWAFTTGGDVSATPAVDDQFVYFPDWAGNLYKVNASTGVAAWSHPLSYYTGVTGDFARATPVIAGNTLIIGTQLNLGQPGTFDGAHVLGINKVTGELQWKTKVEDYFGAIITQSAVVNGNKAYVGVASMEEAFAGDNNYPCCVFRGSVVCLDIKTGQILWKTYMAPAGKDFSGCAVWGSTPVIDLNRNSLYVSTGNNYTVPQEVLDCNTAGGTSEEVRNCIMSVDGSAENYFDAIVALDLNTGAVKWATSVIPFDAWNVGCFFGGDNCPENAGPDYDFGQGPALFSVGSGSAKRDLIGAGQKSGIYWALDPDNGAVVWRTQVGPGSTLGGLQWGSAVDGNRVYTAVSNSYFIPYLMSKGPGAGTTVAGGFWSALNAETGLVVWENAGTQPPAFGAAPAVAYNTGAVTVANGVVFGGAMDANGTMYAFDAATGQKLWSFESGGSVNSGPAIVNGTVYWGSGYSNFGLGTANNKLYAFGLSNTALAVPAGTTPSGNFALGQNYPNPVRTSTEISFEIPETAKVSLVVYDLLGREVARLADETLPAGIYQRTWNAASMPAGTYFYRLMSGAYAESKYLTIIK